MAAAIVPLIAGLAPDIIKLITGLIHREAPAAEAVGGAGTGAVKFAQVFQSVTSSLNAAVSAGVIPKTLPSDDTIKMIIQAVVTSMQIGGMLTPAPTQAPGAQVVVLKAGQTITVSA